MYDIISLLHDVCIKQCLWWGLILILGLGTSLTMTIRVLSSSYNYLLHHAHQF